MTNSTNVNHNNRGTSNVERGKYVSRVFCAFISLYQCAISPLLGTRCRFEPSCSHYAQQALLQHGVFKGALLAVKRLLRCQPWGGSGFDPVPQYFAPPLRGSGRSQAQRAQAESWGGERSDYCKAITPPASSGAQERLLSAALPQGEG